MLTATTIIAAGMPTEAKSLRTMTFKVHYDGQNEEIAHYGGIETGLPGVETAYVSGGFDGTIQADVMALGPDNSIVVRLSQTVPLTHALDFSPALCAVYPDGTVKFNPDTSKFSTPELTLARFLGRGFVDGSKMDDNNHWSTASDAGDVHVKADYTVTKNDGGVVTIKEKRVTKQAMNEDTVDGDITYDMNRTVPVSLVEKSNLIVSTGAVRTSLQISLVSDSMVHP